MFTTEVIKSLSSTKLYSKSLRQALESKVMTDPEWAYWYALYVMKLNGTPAKEWSGGNYPAVKENVYKAVPIGV